MLVLSSALQPAVAVASSTWRIGPDQPRAAVEAEQAVAQRLLRQILQPRVERGPHPQPARIDAERPVARGLAELADQLAPHLLDEIAADRARTWACGAAIVPSGSAIAVGVLRRA